MWNGVDGDFRHAVAVQIGDHCILDLRSVSSFAEYFGIVILEDVSLNSEEFFR